MTPRQRKAALIMSGITMSEIAQQLGVSKQHVSMVVAGVRRSPATEEAVARAIGKPALRVFGPVPVAA